MIYGWGRFDWVTFLDMVEPQVIDLLKKNTQKKVHFVLWCEMEHRDTRVVEEIDFHSDNGTILDATNVKELYDNAVETLQEQIANFLRNRSGWVFRSVVQLEIHTTIYKTLTGGRAG